MAKQVEMPSSFVDWGEFETFVKYLYASDGTVSAERNVTVIGKSGAKRQIDVRVTLQTTLHTYVTVAECKRWREPVSRDRIDVLAATVEDIGAAKGVMFTTTGYEQGAIQYAKSKAIDLFLVRDLTDEEWGLPARYIRFYSHFVASRLGHFETPDALLITTVPGWKPVLNVTIDDRADTSPSLYVATADKPGTTIGRVITAIKKGVTKRVGDAVPLLEGGKRDAVANYRTDVIATFGPTFHFRDVRFPEGTLRLTTITATLFTQVRQSKIERDRADGVDLAVALHDFINDRAKVVTQVAGTETITVDDVKLPTVADRQGALVNDTILKAYVAGNGLPDDATPIVVTPVQRVQIG